MRAIRQRFGERTRPGRLARAFGGAAILALLASTPLVATADEPPLHPGEFFVRVVDGFDRPVPLVRVTVLMTTESPDPDTELPVWSAAWTDLRGVARLARPTFESFAIAVEPEEWPQKLLGQPQLPAGRTPLEVKLETGVRVTLTVPAPGFGDDGSPPPGWGTVTLWGPKPSGTSRRVSLDGREVEIDGLAAGDYTVVLHTQWGDRARWSEPLRITAAPQQFYVLPRPKARQLKGTVIYNGQPATGGEIRFATNQGGGLLTETLGLVAVDDNGKFEIELFDTESLRLEYSPPDTDSFHHYALYDVPPEGVAVTLTLSGPSEATPVTRRLVDQLGAPLPDVVVELRFSELKHYADGRPVRIETDSDGSFSAPFLRYGQHQWSMIQGPRDLLAYAYAQVTESNPDIVIQRGRQVVLRGLDPRESVRVWCDRGEILDTFVRTGAPLAIPFDAKQLFCINTFPRKLGVVQVPEQQRNGNPVTLTVAMQPAAELKVRPWKTWLSSDHKLELVGLEPENAGALIVRGWQAWFVSKPGKYRLRHWNGDQLLREETVTLELGDDSEIDLDP